MKAMILAAGRGERMRPLTDTTPKALLQAGGRPLIAHHLLALRVAGIEEIVINLGHLGRDIAQTLGDGAQYGTRISYSDEGDAPLETAGGIKRALTHLGTDPFIVVNGDVWTDYPFSRLTLGEGRLARIVLVDNPEHHLCGDFALEGELVSLNGGPRLTYSGIGIYHPNLFRECPPGSLPLAPLLREAARSRLLEGEYYAGEWRDIGTPERLSTLDQELTEGFP